MSVTWSGWGQGLAVVVGATGGIGRALHGRLVHEWAGGLGQQGDVVRPDDGSAVIALSRRSTPALDVLDEASVQAAAAHAAERAGMLQQPVRLVVDATGFLHGEGMQPEKSWRQLDARHMAHAFAVNAIGPALLMKHFLPLLPREGGSVFATLSAKVGSIGDNRLGGWYSYRASKAALNQLVRTASVELARGRPQAVCVALHPGTVNTGLSASFAKTGLTVHTPEQAAQNLCAVLRGLTPADNGGFLDWQGQPLPW